jgi:predicted molibdopterin-dependent oxidoreductase YjgC
MTGDLRIKGSRGPALRFGFDGRNVEAFAGETIAVALLAAGIPGFALNPVDGTPRGQFCAMGTCQECIIYVDGLAREACRTIVSDGLMVRSRR